jgi:group I intron endonuclease
MEKQKFYSLFYIYRIDNSVNNKIYIGRTSRPVRREQEYKFDSLKKENKRHTPIIRSMRKHGFDKFTFTVISVHHSYEEMCYTEEDWISFIKENDIPTYNVDNGGHGGQERPYEIGGKHSKDTKEKCRLMNLGRKKTEEQKANSSKAQIGLKAGEKSPFAKLNQNQVNEIRAKLSNGETVNNLYIQYNVSYRSIKRIENNETWIIENLPIGPQVSHRAGSDHPTSKLTWEIVDAIRSEEGRCKSNRVWAKELNLGDTTIQCVRKFITWKPSNRPT